MRPTAFSRDFIDSDERDQYAFFQVFYQTVHHFFGGFSFLTRGVDDPRQAGKIRYSLRSLLFAGVFLFFKTITIIKRNTNINTRRNLYENKNVGTPVSLRKS